MDISDRENGDGFLLKSSACVFYSLLTNSTVSIRRSKPNTSATLHFANLFGLRRAKDDLNRYIVFPVRLFSSGRIKVNDFQFRTILFYGPPGCGKSTLALATANESGASLTVVNAETLTKLDLAVQTTTIFLLDDVDRMAKLSAVNSIVKVLSQIRVCLCPALLIATVQKRSNLVAEIRSLFDVEVEVPVPTATERRELIEALASSRPNSLAKADFDDIALMSQGYTYSDLKSLFKEGLCSLQTLWYLENNSRAVLNRDLLLKAAKKIHPSAMREITLDIPQVKWADIGGELELKQKLQQMVEWPLRHPDAFKRLGIRPPKGILMYGPPGCSKTMIARALATESNLNFLAVKGPELFSKYVGESEKAVREIFRKARQVAPAVIFFDEIDALASSRSQDQAGVGNRVLAQLLTEMDGIEPLNEVIIVAATNRPDMIDDALLRPGRLDRIVAVPLPDERTRRDILNIRLGRMPIDKNVDIEKLVKATDAFSGAEVSSLCDEAALLAMQEDFDATEVHLRKQKLRSATMQARVEKSTSISRSFLNFRNDSSRNEVPCIGRPKICALQAGSSFAFGL
ncbi:Spermatogenesis associated protein 5 [Trichuris trichiura]|uniref:Spermatogenesis associated protein 5 n=1 Tax=Trichuris trichiura TaxID=36087 RepID=A0A077Z2I5_TRITR|nr:Spermatogenesis associated protein 5 [Trichuris trichiura]